MPSLDIITIWQICKNLTDYLTNFTRKSDQNLTIFDRKSHQLTWKNLNYFLTITRTNNALIVCTEQKNLTLKFKARSTKFLDMTFPKGKKWQWSTSWKSDLDLNIRLFWPFFGKNLTTFGTFGSKSQIIWPWSD